jgi:hypothetical protein
MPNWQQLSPMEQQQKLADITSEVLETLPEGWQRLVVRSGVVGRYSEMSAGVRMSDGTTRGWAFPPEVWRKFQQLRKGMYADGIGTWVEFEYIVDPPGRFSINYNRDNRPTFDGTPTQDDFATEYRWFPRSEENMPEWFRRGLAAAPPSDS